MTTPNWLRWVLVLPAGVGALIAVNLVAAAAGISDPGAWVIEDYWRQALSSVAGPYVLVRAGAATAPSWRGVTAVALAGLHAIVGVVIVMLAAEHRMRRGISLWWLAATCLAGIAASIVAVVQVSKKDDSSLGGLN